MLPLVPLLIAKTNESRRAAQKQVEGWCSAWDAVRAAERTVGCDIPLSASVTTDLTAKAEALRTVDLVTARRNEVEFHDAAKQLVSDATMLLQNKITHVRNDIERIDVETGQIKNSIKSLEAAIWNTYKSLREDRGVNIVFAIGKGVGSGCLSYILAGIPIAVFGKFVKGGKNVQAILCLVVLVILFSIFIILIVRSYSKSMSPHKQQVKRLENELSEAKSKLTKIERSKQKHSGDDQILPLSTQLHNTETALKALQNFAQTHA